MSENDWNNAVNYARELGMKEGMKEGQTQIAKNLLAMGMSVGDIAKATGLSVEEVSSIA